MVKRHWFFLCIIQAITLTLIVIIFLWSQIIPTYVKNVNLNEYLIDDNYGFIPENGLIPNAKTAKKVGRYFLKELNEKKSFLQFGSISVEYDEENRLWKVSKGFGFRRGGVVIINQDNGQVVKSFLTK